MSSGLIGVLLTNEARGHLISGARLESNEVMGIWVNGWMNVIETSWFEGSGAGPKPTQGIRITNLAKKTRVIANLFSSQLIEDAGDETRLCFNMSFDPLSEDVNQPKCQ
jgi:hypothetical protein